MAITGNKGEWSELYAFFRLLGDGKVHAGDANLKKLETYYPILDIIRQELNNIFNYKPYHEGNIVIITADGKEYRKIPMKEFLDESSSLLDAIKEASGRAFEVPNTEKFMNKIGCTRVTAPSDDKADIHVVIYDMHTGMKHNQGFSIKSQLGSPSTLLNADKSTNITYLVTGREMSEIEMNEINAIKDHLPRIAALFNRGYQLAYTDVDNKIFKNNLCFLDCCMPQFIAECLIADSQINDRSTIKNITEAVAQKNPLNYCGSNILTFYEHKMKVLLIDAALGMTPAKVWNGRYRADGGYLVVKKDGDIVCYHFYNRNDVEDYLYNNTRIERGSRTRHHFGSLYRDSDGKVYIKLNLQIRFLK